MPQEPPNSQQTQSLQSTAAAMVPTNFLVLWYWQHCLVGGTGGITVPNSDGKVHQWQTMIMMPNEDNDININGNVHNGNAHDGK